ncbi:hypothetical protein D3C75_1308260 [compost metagenome]
MHRLAVVTTVLWAHMAMDNKLGGNIFQTFADFVTDEAQMLTTIRAVGRFWCEHNLFTR